MKRLIAALAFTSLLAGSALAQSNNYPTRPITLINPYSAGGPSDLLARTVAEGMEKALGQPVVVENKVGGGTVIAGSFVARAEPDGYTLLIAGSPTHIVAPAITKDVKYDGIKDFAFIASVGNVPNVLVVPADRPYKTIKELIDAAKKADGKMNFASVGQGSLPQLLGLKLQQTGNIKLIHVPYGGAAPASTDLLAGRIDLAFLNMPPLVPHIQAGKLRALGIANATRSPALPDLPTLTELGYPGFELSTWYGISAPAGTPKPIIEKLNAAIDKAIKGPGVKEKLAKAGVEIFYKDSAAYAAYVQSDAKRMLDLIDAAGMRAK